MQFLFSFKHMETSDALRSYAESKIRDKISKFATKPIEAHMTFSVDKHLHTAHLGLVGGDGFNLQVEHSCEDMYGSVDRMVDKLEMQLRRAKEKLKTHKTKRDRFLDAKSGDGDGEAIDADDILKYENARRRAGAGG